MPIRENKFARRARQRDENTNTKKVVYSDEQPTVEEASRYLRERDGTVSATTQDGVYQLVKTEQASYAVFELRDISLVSPLRLHFNKMDR